MATIMLIVERADGSYVEWCGAGIRDRLATRLRAAKLDRELAPQKEHGRCSSRGACAQ